MSQTTLDTDNFSGTAGTALNTYNANWITLSGQWFDAIITTPNGGATANASGSSGDYRTGQTWTNDQFAQATFATLATTGFESIFVRLTKDGGNNPITGYQVGINPNGGDSKYRLYLVDFTLLAVSATTATAGDIINLEVIGTTITVRKNGSVISDLTTTDASYSSGNPGLFTNDTVTKFTNWSAGSVTSTSVFQKQIGSSFRLAGPGGLVS